MNIACDLAAFNILNQPNAAVINNLSSRNTCVFASTAQLTAAYNNGASGVGATLTNSGANSAFTSDGYTPAVGDRYLYKDEITHPERNGIYTVTTVGSGSVPWVLTRAADYNSSSQITRGNFLYVSGGATNRGFWYLATTAAVTVGTTALNFYSVLQSKGVYSSIISASTTLSYPLSNVYFINPGAADINLDFPTWDAKQSNPGDVITIINNSSQYYGTVRSGGVQAVTPISPGTMAQIYLNQLNPSDVRSFIYASSIPVLNPVADATTLRLLPTNYFPDGTIINVYGLGINYQYSTTSTATDNSVTVIKPSRIAGGNAGRWLAILSDIYIEDNTTARVLSNSDSGAEISMINPAANTVTINTGLTLFKNCAIRQGNTGQTTIQAGAGVMLLPSYGTGGVAGSTKIIVPYERAYLRQTLTPDTYFIDGGITP